MDVIEEVTVWVGVPVGVNVGELDGRVAVEVSVSTGETVHR